MGYVKYYDVYDGDEKILENVTRYEIENYIGEKLPGLTTYVTNKFRFKDRYMFTYSNVNSDNTDPYFKEWEDAVRPFKNVVWVKRGGRKLKIGGKS